MFETEQFTLQKLLLLIYFSFIFFQLFDYYRLNITMLQWYMCNFGPAISYPQKSETMRRTFKVLKLHVRERSNMISHLFQRLTPPPPISHFITLALYPPPHRDITHLMGKTHFLHDAKH